MNEWIALSENCFVKKSDIIAVWKADDLENAVVMVGKDKVLITDIEFTKMKGMLGIDL